MPRGGPDAKVVVVTGTTGSGKSTLCRWLDARGAFVVDADRVGHEMLLRPDVQTELADAFGRDILGSDNVVDRALLGARAFASPQALQQLNRRIHPPLVAEMERRIQRLRGSRAVELIVVDAALHYQFEPRLDCDAVIATTVDVDEAVRRLIARDGLTAEEARQRLARQEDVRRAAESADLVLDTGGDREKLRRSLLEGIDRLTGLRLSASDPRPA